MELTAVMHKLLTFAFGQDRVTGTAFTCPLKTTTKYIYCIRFPDIGHWAAQDSDPCEMETNKMSPISALSPTPHLLLREFSDFNTERENTGGTNVF